MFKRCDAWATRLGGYGNWDTPGGLFIAPIGPADSAREWLAIRWDDIWDATGETEGPRYSVDVLMVDIHSNQLANAAKSCGISVRDGDGWKQQELSDYPPAGLAEMLVSYGAYAPLWSEGGNAIHSLLATALREAEDYRQDEQAREERLDGAPVNAIGSTPREFMSGDIDAAMSRGLAAGQVNAKVMAQMYHPIPTGAVSANIGIGAMQAEGIDDPLAYSMGFLEGFQGSELPVTEEDDSLADAYIKGRSHGADCRMRRQPLPAWIG